MDRNSQAEVLLSWSGLRSSIVAPSPEAGNAVEGQTRNASAEAAEALGHAAQMYDRYIELSGVARLATEAETEDWLRGWQTATMQGNPVGLTLLNQAPPTRQRSRE